jgi:hypothetical protein
MFDAHFFAETKLREELQEFRDNPLSSLGCTVGLIEDNN